MGSGMGVAAELRTLGDSHPVAAGTLGGDTRDHRGSTGSWHMLIGLWLPQAEALSADVRRRAELLVAMAVLLSAGAALRAASLALAGAHLQAWAAAAAATALAAVVGVVRRTGAMGLAGNLFCLPLFVVGTAMAWSRGGVGAPVLVAVGAVPLLAVVLAGRRSGVGWFALFVVEVLALARAEQLQGTRLPDLLAPDRRLATETLGAILFAALILGVGLAYETLKDAALHAHARAERQRLQAENDANIRAADRMISLGQVAVGLAHEVNNPLTVVMGNLDFVLHELAASPYAGLPGVADLRAALVDARGGVDRVATTVSQLQAFARQGPDAETETDACAAADTAVRLLDTELRARGRVVLQIPEAPVLVSGSAARVIQVVISLVQNACQALDPQRQPSNLVQVSVSGTATAGEVVVMDNGCGMPPDVLRRAMEPFFSTRQGSAGLGLAICDGIVRALGGVLAVDSGVAEGTTVRLTLPRATGSAAPGGSLPPAR